jgi:molybdate transport system ATP-binding protein
VRRSRDVLSVELAKRLGSLEIALRFEVGDGECVALAGPSGAGKTSIVRMVAGLLRPDRGAIRCDGETWLDTESGIDLPPERRRCGFVFQEYALFPHLRAWQNVAYGIRGTPRAERRQRAIRLLDSLHAGEIAEARPATLSGGERQRVALARALARDPEVLLLDEPLSALDPRTRAHAASELGEVLRRSSIPAIVITHDFADASLLGDRVGVLDGGRLVQLGSAAELAAAPVSGFVADFAGASVLIGIAKPGPEGLTRVELEGGGAILSTDTGAGPVAASVYPWDVSLERPGEVATGSALNHLPVEVVGVTLIGNRARVRLAAPQAIVAETTAASAERLGIEAGGRLVATWKATATRLVER